MLRTECLTKLGSRDTFIWLLVCSCASRWALETYSYFTSYPSTVTFKLLSLWLNLPLRADILNPGWIFWSIIISHSEIMHSCCLYGHRRHGVAWRGGPFIRHPIGQFEFILENSNFLNFKWVNINNTSKQLLSAWIRSRFGWSREFHCTKLKYRYLRMKIFNTLIKKYKILNFQICKVNKQTLLWGT